MTYLGILICVLDLELTFLGLLNVSDSGEFIGEVPVLSPDESAALLYSIQTNIHIE